MYQNPISQSSMSIQGQLLEVTVVGCNNLKDTEWISKQDPYVCVEYGSSKYRTRTCTDGHKNPTFQEKFVFTLIEGLRELNVAVWNSNTLKHDDYIGSGKVQLQKALSQGFDDSTWPLQTRTGRYAGEVRLIIHFSNVNSQKPGKNYTPSAPPASQASMYSMPPPASSVPYPAPAVAYPGSTGYPPYPAPSPYPSYPPNAGAYPPSSYPPPPSTYPPQPYPPPSTYPPSPYPPNPHGPPYYPPGSYPGTYPPPY